MVLVMVAVAVALMLTVSYVSSQGTTATVITRTADETQARLIAESGLNLAIRHITDDDEWRSGLNEGLWVNGQSLGGGTFDIELLDGDESGGDDSIIDDDTDEVYLIVAASFNGATHRVDAILRPGIGASVETGVMLGYKLKMEKDSLIDSFDSSQGAYGGSNTGSDAVVVLDTSSSNKGDLDAASEIRGKAYSAYGSDADSVYENAHVVTGGVDTMSDALTSPTVTPPTGPAFDSGASSVDYDGTVNIAADTFTADVKVKDSTTINVTDDAALVVDGKFEIEDDLTINVSIGKTLSVFVSNDFKSTKEIDIDINGNVVFVIDNTVDYSKAVRFQVRAGGSAAFYVGNDFKVAKDSVFNTDAADPSMLAVSLTNDKTIDIDKDVEMYAQFVGPDAKMKVEKDTHIYGTIHAKELEMKKDSAFHMDISGTSGDGGGDGPSSPAVRWVSAD